jgi:alpha-tubulin suppressor-like RCC1 family protein
VAARRTDRYLSASRIIQSYIHRRHLMPRLLVVFLVGSVVLAGCGEDGGETVGPSTGTLVVQTVTTGTPEDPDGYTVSVDNGAVQAIGNNASLEIDGLTEGAHSALLAGLSQECAVIGENPRSVNITAGSTAEISFSISCSSGPAPTQTFKAVAAGGAHSCALAEDGSAYCWGRSESGQLGAPGTTSCPLDPDVFPCALLPVAVTGGMTFDQITAGGSHTCARTADGTAYCWGNNVFGQLGNNSTASSQAPVAVATELRFEVLDAGANHTCGITTGGTSVCWGRNDRGQLGDETTTNRLVPVAVSGEHAFLVLTVGGFNIGHTCGLLSGGAAYCWGDNERGQLGNGSADIASHTIPVAVAGSLTFASLSAGLGRHTCGLGADGSAYCWGENAYGALGDGSSTQRTTPVPVASNGTFAQIRAGGFIGHSCGLTAAGSAFCWGENERGQVGDGTAIDRLSPVAVVGGLVFADVQAGFRHTCGLTTDHTLYCWGSGAAGQLGINSKAQMNAPTQVLVQP